jgi:hypothetical protein
MNFRTPLDPNERHNPKAAPLIAAEQRARQGVRCLPFRHRVQLALGAILGVAVQATVAWILIFHAMPAVGLGLLDLARGLAALDLPVRAVAFFAGV